MFAGCFETACRSKLSEFVRLCETLVLCLRVMYLSLLKFTLQVCIYIDATSDSIILALDSSERFY
jgi:hypothetical protein